jgi:hypothetical protein
MNLILMIELNFISVERMLTTSEKWFPIPKTVRFVYNTKIHNRNTSIKAVVLLQILEI